MNFFGGKLFRTLAFGSGMRVVALMSQFIVIILLGNSLNPTQFGDFMIAFAFYRLAALFIGTGTGTLQSYYVARGGENATINVPLHRSLGLLTLALSLGAAWLICGQRASIAEFFGKPGLELWLTALWPMLPLGALLNLAVGALEGQGDVRQAILLNELFPNLARLIGLACVILFGGSIDAVAMVFWGAQGLAWLVVLSTLLWPPYELARLTPWDMRFAGLYGLNSLAAQQLQGIDLIIVGYLFSSEQAASYAIASRIAAFYPYLQTVAIRQYTRVIGIRYASDETAALNRSLLHLRRISRGLVGIVLLTCAVGWPILEKAFSTYKLDSSIIVALAAPMIMRTAFAGLDIVLRMSGQAGYNLVITFLAAASMAFSALLFSSSMGLAAIAFGMLLGSVALNTYSAMLLRRMKVVATDQLSFFFGLVVALLAMALAYSPYPVLSLGGIGFVMLTSSFWTTFQAVMMKKLGR